MKKIILLGSNSFIAQKVLDNVMKMPGFEIMAVSKSENRYQNHKLKFRKIDITESAKIEALIKDFKPEFVINFSAISQPEQCFNNKTYCREVNVGAVRHIAICSKKYGFHFIHMSSDFVFNGKSDIYNEDSVPNPINYYGESKLESEGIVKALAEKWTIIRTIQVYGFARKLARTNFVTRLVKELSENKFFKVPTDQYRSMTLAEDLAAGITQIIIRSVQGIFHLSGEENIRLIDLAYRIAELFDLKKELIVPCTTAILHPDSPRPSNSNFDLSKAKAALNYKPHSIDEGLLLVKKQMDK